MKRTVCRVSRSGRFAKKAKCRAFKRGKITIRKTDKAGQFLLILGAPKKKARRT
jgi:hypothetical protein